VLTTDQKGAIAEAAIALAALELGIPVSRPLVESPYDLIFELGTKLIRVQCKCATRRGDVIIVRCYRSRRSADGLLRTYYTDEEVDAFAAYCAELRRCFFLPISCMPRGQAIHLRLLPTLNNQRDGINWADQYDFAATLARRTWGRSSVGRATGWQPVGHGFESRRLHARGEESPRPVLFDDE
jgi:PD-(D/E)XK endonuclease